MAPLTLTLAEPRGFCAGVTHAIEHVERALALWGPPVYVRHEIVHNRHVVDRLRARGAVFVDELDEVPDGARVIFSAHGVPRSVPEAAEARNLPYLDATCPLVRKVHREALRHHEAGRHVLLIGKPGHQEVIGTLGQVPEGVMTVVPDTTAAHEVTVPDPEKVAYVTQTTLSVDDAAAVIAVLQARFPALVGPAREDICYATTNRQNAVKALAPRVEALLVLGTANSSNSRRLVEVARRAGCERAELVDGPESLDVAAFDDVTTLGMTAGASAPEDLVQGMVNAFRARRPVKLDTLAVAEETVSFRLPAALRAAGD